MIYMIYIAIYPRCANIINKTEKALRKTDEAVGKGKRKKGKLNWPASEQQKKAKQRKSRWEEENGKLHWLGEQES